jgi:ABC-type amino acid transport substrate-binding protein
VTAYAHLRTGDLRLVGTLLTDEPYVIAARVDSPLLMAGVSRAIEEWQANGFLDALLRRWF